MLKIDCLRGVLARVWAKITFRGQEGPGGDRLWVAVATCSDQSSESYAKRVTVQWEDQWGGPPQEVEEFGSLLDWGPNDPPRLVGDGSAAFLEVAENGDLLLRQEGYGHGGSDGNWSGSTGPRKICGLNDVVKMEFETTSGWRGECYPERVYDPATATVRPRPYREADWLVILHRSTGAVTIEREFPF